MKATRQRRISEEELAERWFSVKHQAFEHLLECFRASGMKQKELADRLGMDESRVSRLLKGRNNMTLRVMCNLARAMEHRLEVEFRDLRHAAKSNVFFNAREAEAESNWVIGGADRIPVFMPSQAASTGSDESIMTRRFP